MDEAGVLTNIAGVAVHDAWASYDGYEQATHALCNSHLVRKLIAVTDYHQANPPGSGGVVPGTSLSSKDWCWAQQVSDGLLGLKRLSDSGQVPEELLQQRRASILHVAQIGLADSPPGKLGAKHRALARRIIRRIDDYLRFATDMRWGSPTTSPRGISGW